MDPVTNVVQTGQVRSVPHQGPMGNAAIVRAAAGTIEDDQESRG